MKRDLSHIRSQTFRGKRYDIVWRRPPAGTTCHACGQRTKKRVCDGECDPPRNVSKCILIGARLSERDFLETAIHEALHACVWDLDEEAVDQTADDIARFLRRIGFKLE